MLPFPQVAFDIRSRLDSDDIDAAECVRILSEVRQANPVVANAVLCLIYNVCAYNVGESASLFSQEIPPSDYSRWFVAVDAGGPLDIGKDIPLGEDMHHAFALAVEHFQLFDMYQARAAVLH
jgi:hypothetical protein